MAIKVWFLKYQIKPKKRFFNWWAKGCLTKSYEICAPFSDGRCLCICGLQTSTSVPSSPACVRMESVVTLWVALFASVLQAWLWTSHKKTVWVSIGLVRQCYEKMKTAGLYLLQKNPSRMISFFYLSCFDELCGRWFQQFPRTDFLLIAMN